jgi:hypothetical protein
VKRLGLLALCLVLTGSVAPTEAKKKRLKGTPLGQVVTIAAAGNTASEPGTSTATAACPPGTKVVGGGFKSPLMDGAAVVVHASYRSSPNTWTVAGVAVEGAGGVTAEAYCRNTKRRPVTETISSVAFNTSGEIHTLNTACPRGRLIGGGFRSTTIPGDDAVIFPQVNQATGPNSWTVTGVANQDGARTLTAIAYCMRKLLPPMFVNAVNALPVGPLDSLAALTPECPIPTIGKQRKKRARKLSAGGFSATVNGSPSAPAMVFDWTSVSQVRRWFARATNAFTATGNVSMTSQGICF